MSFLKITLHYAVGFILGITGLFFQPYYLSPKGIVWTGDLKTWQSFCLSHSQMNIGGYKNITLFNPVLLLIHIFLNVSKPEVLVLFWIANWFSLLVLPIWQVFVGSSSRTSGRLCLFHSCPVTCDLTAGPLQTI